MDLHRAGSAPDWEQTAKKDWNVWQRAAAVTGGIITPGNLLTGVGLALTIAGLLLLTQNHFIAGTIALAVGRFCDIADGWAAGATDTKAQLGESFDATADKVATFLTLIVFFAIEAAPRWAILLLVLPQLVGTFAVLYRRRRRTRLHPALAGKIGMAFAWFSLLGFALSNGVGSDGADILNASAWILAAVSAALSSYAVAGYIAGRS